PPLPFIGQFCLRDILINLKKFASNHAYLVMIKCAPTTGTKNKLEALSIIHECSDI
ncbi:MAG: hypothetical protein FD137_1143, partial [Spirochaetes bacterium]